MFTTSARDKPENVVRATSFPWEMLFLEIVLTRVLVFYLLVVLQLLTFVLVVVESSMSASVCVCVSCGVSVFSLLFVCLVPVVCVVIVIFVCPVVSSRGILPTRGCYAAPARVSKVQQCGMYVPLLYEFYLVGYDGLIHRCLKPACVHCCGPYHSI